MVAQLSQLQRLFVLEPYLWLQRCFFQPARFMSDFEAISLPRRLSMAARLIPMLFFYAYIPALILRILIYSARPDLYPNYPTHALIPLGPTLFRLVLDATWAAALGCSVAALFTSLFSLRFAIASALAIGFAGSVIVNTGDDTLVGIIFGISLGIALGIAFNSAHTLTEGGLRTVTIASALGIVSGILAGYLTGTIAGYWAGFWLGETFPELQNSFVIGGSVIGIFAAGPSACLLVALLGRIVRSTVRGKEQAIALCIKISIAVAGTFGATIGIPVGDSGFSGDTFMQGCFDATVEIAIVGSVFLLFYLISYYRLPLYPISANSVLQAYLASQRQPQRTLYNLRHCSLHWDECVFLPLPYLRQMLLLAAAENLDGTLEEIDFILERRDRQSWAARAAAYELALRDLEQRTSLRSIGQAHQRLALLLPRKVRSSSVSAESAFRHLGDASLEAASSYAQIDKVSRQEALERTLRSLQAIRSRTIFGSAELNQKLNLVVHQWEMLAAQGQDMLQSLPGSMYIENPFTPGNPMEVGDPLFTGRDDILQKLGQALQQRYRPSFLLTGERRMGKSSLLKQLPVVLGPRYIPIFYDLQAPGMIASTSAFFASIAAEVERHVLDRGLEVPTLSRAQLDAARQEDEIKVYDVFEQWYTQVEQAIDQSDRTLLLMFDEFETLEEAETRGTIDLHLLFKWVRSVAQNRSRLVLLFSGAKMVDDMGRSWAGYFVNIERIKVSFLREADAHNLIVRPVPHIFNADVAAEIIDITHGHPFLIQALCKHIIEILLEKDRSEATSADVERAAEEVFESWGDYFWDLWDRCEHDQHCILFALFKQGSAEAEQLVAQLDLDRPRIQRALEKLQMRDLVIHAGALYRLAIPLFTRWIEQNQYLLLPSPEA